MSWLGSHSPGGGVQRPDFPPEETMTSWIYERQQPLVIPFIDQETRFPRVAESSSAIRGLRSICALPASPLSGVASGSFGFCSKFANAYSEEEVRFLSLVVDQIALAIDDALHAEELERKNKRLALLLDLNNAVVSNLELRDLLRAMSANVAARSWRRCDGVGVAFAESSRAT